MTARAPLFIDSAGGTFGRVLAVRHVDGFVFRKSTYRRRLRMPDHCHPDAYLSFVVAGALDERNPGGEHRYGPGTLHFHPSGDRHSVSTGDQGLVCMSIIPADSGATRLREGRAKLRPGPLGAMLTRLAARCHREFQADDSASDLALEGAGLELLATLLRASTPSERRVPRWLAEARDYLHAHPDERVLLGSLARLTGVHPVHLVRSFRLHFGATPAAYVRRLRIIRACDALARPEPGIVQIALEAGYSSQAHFTRVFRRLMGTTPAAYRRAHRTRVELP